MSPELAAQYPKESRLAARPSGAFTPGDYNAVEVLLTDNSVQPKFNGGSLGGNSGRPIPDAERDGYGQIGFYVGGSGEVRIKDFMYKDILNHVWAPDETGRNFKQVRIDPHYYSWSTAVADFNHDNIPDVAAGAFYYLGPDYTVGKQIYTPRVVQSDGGMADSGDGQPRLRFHRGWLARCAADGRQCRQRYRLPVRESEGAVAPLGEVPRRLRRSATRKPSSRTSTATAGPISSTRA